MLEGENGLEVCFYACLVLKAVVVRSQYYVTFVTYEGRFVGGPVLGAVSVMRAAVRWHETAQCVPASCALTVIL